MICSGTLNANRKRSGVCANSLLGLLAFGSAVAQTANLAGHYTLQYFREAGSELLLKSDGNFDFMLAYGAADYWAKGTWRVENGSVILSSTSQTARAISPVGE